MRQAIHIFKKDVRHLWPAILVVVTFAIVFASVGALSIPVLMQYSSTLDRYNTFISLIMPLGWWYLIALVVQEEALPGHRQFWVTRPYSWKSLLAAKGLFILAFVNLPKLAADCVILQAQGFHAASYWPNLISAQILFTAAWLLPFAALAAITRNLRQFSLAVLILCVVLFALPVLGLFGVPFEHGFGAAWMQDFVIIGVLLISSLFILLWQYSQRRTAISRAMAAFAMVLVLGIPQLLPVRAMMAMQLRLSNPKVDVSPIRISMDPTRKRPKQVVTGSYEGTIRIDIPVQVTGLPEGMDLYSDILTTEVAGPDGRKSKATGLIVREEDGFWQKIYVDLPVFQHLQNEEVTLFTSAYLTVLGEQRTTQVEPRERATEVPGLGICRFAKRGDNWMLACFSPFRRPSLFAKTFLFDMSGHPYVEPGSYSPYPAEAVINPLVVSVRGNGSISGTRTEPVTATIVTEVPMAHLRGDFEVRGLRLGDYAIK